MGQSFTLEDEVRSDYLVTKEVKQLWNVMLDLFVQLDKICKENDIRYYAAGGTLLGAVRHQGFIPWDDDMDFFMPFDDYKRFCQIASEQLKAPYCFQYYKNTSDCSPVFARLRNSNTTGCTEGEYDVVPPHNLGIYIDIFPLFYVPKGKVARKMQYYKIKFWGVANAGHRIVLRKKYDKTLKFKDYFKLHVLTWNFISLFMGYEKSCQKFLDACNYQKEKEFLALSSFFPGKEKYTWNAEWFAKSVSLPFEDKVIDCPEGYHEVLSHQYGDYMKFVKGGAIHTMGVIDPNTPYWVTFQERFGDNHD